MSDLTVQCAACKLEMLVSEYVDPEQILCHECGRKVELPADSLILHHRFPEARDKPGECGREESSTRDPSDDTVVASRAVKARSSGRRQTKKRYGKGAFWGSLIGLAGALTFFRFVEVLPVDVHDVYKDAGLLALLVCHLLICVEAFAYDISQGVVCVFVPFYSLVFLYSRSEFAFLRASVGALLISFGYDAFWKFREIVDWAMNTVVGDVL